MKNNKTIKMAIISLSIVMVLICGLLILNTMLKGENTMPVQDVKQTVEEIVVQEEEKKEELNQKIYYVDAFLGDDENDGISEQTPWKSFLNVNNTVFQPGDQILLKADSIFDGTLHPLGEGTVEEPIVIDMYGFGNRPIINGNGKESAVCLRGQSNFEIRHLEVTNDAAKEGNRRGIFIQGADVTTHIYITDCYVHNVRGNNDFSTGKPTGGIVIMGNGSENTRFDDVLIEGNTINLCDRTGIYFGDGCGDGKSFVNTGVVVRNNVINYPGGDGAIIHFCDGGLIEYNTVNTTDNVSIQVSAGIWPWYCANTVFQYNEGYGCKYSFDYDDGMPWDIDGGNQNCIYQYNYSHDNDGGSIMICADDTCPSNNSIIRYNISQNDGGRVLTLTGPSTNTYFYNNTVYLSEEKRTDIVGANHLGGDHSNLYAYNNIFYNLGSGGFDMGKSTGNDFDYNVYFGEKTYGIPDDPHKIIEDPKFVDPGKGGIGRDSVFGYKLQPDSPCIDAGKYIENNGGKDYWGTLLNGEGTIDIGASEYVDPSSLGRKKDNRYTSSSDESEDYCAANAFDGDADSRWSSEEGARETEWIQADLGEVRQVSKVTVKWEAAYAIEYEVQLSVNGEDFITVDKIENGTGDVCISEFEASEAKFVRLYCTKKYDSDWGYSIFEIYID